MPINQTLTSNLYLGISSSSIDQMSLTSTSPNEDQGESQHESPVAETSRYYCLCSVCESHGDDFVTGDNDEVSTVSQTEEECHGIVKHRLHLKIVTKILMNCPDMATLIVGPKKQRLMCHKALLGLYSEFFDAALYGDFRESTTSTIEFPEESPDEVAAFLSWIYSGTIESNINAAKLWVLGDKLMATDFCNMMMYLLMNTYGNAVGDGGEWLSASTVDYVYSHTTKHSLLRRFVRDLLIAEGPLCKRALETYAGDKGHYKRAWDALIYRGGDLCLEVAKVSSFSIDTNIDPDGKDIVNPEAPYLSRNQFKYLWDMRRTRTAEDYISGIQRS